MNYRQTCTRWYKSFIKTIQLQLFISFISLPFLLAWGLPISMVSPLSTLLFGPFLTIFLCISLFIFFCEFLYIPNSIFIVLLEKVSSLWLYCLKLEQKSWLIACTKPPLLVLLLIPGIALAIMHFKKIKNDSLKTIILTIALVLLCFILKFFPYHRTSFEKIPEDFPKVILIHHHESFFLIDNGAFSKPSFESYITYTLIPEIIQKKGTLFIDHLIIRTVNKRIFDALYFFVNKIKVKNIYVPTWKGKIPTCAWKSYVKLKKYIKNNGGNILPLYHTKNMSDERSMHITITPMLKDIKYYDALYQKLSVHGIVNGESFIIQ